jgi:hypothetical protein
MITEAERCGRSALDNKAESSARLPESDRDDMEVFLQRIRQVLPVLGVDLLTPIAGSAPAANSDKLLSFSIKGAVATGILTDTGFVVFKGSTAVKELRPHAKESDNFTAKKRKSLMTEGTLSENTNGLLEFTRDVEFRSPSGAAPVIAGGNTDGPKSWRDRRGTPLKDLLYS